MTIATAAPPREIFSTARLHLRPVALSDAQALFVARGDAEVCRYWSGPALPSVAACEDELRRFIEDDKGTSWAITRREEAPSGDALGWVTLMHVREGVGEIGFILRKDEWGAGLASEAARAMIARAFAEWGYRRIFGDVDPRNDSSVMLLKRLGFQFEGRLRANWRVNDELCDSDIYALLRDEWRA